MATVEIEVEPEVMEKVRKVVDAREKTLEKKPTIAETCSFLVGTGAGRYLAATGWAKKNPQPKKPRKARAPKAKKEPKVKAKKEPKAKAKKEPKPEAPKTEAPAAASPLD